MILTIFKNTTFISQPPTKFSIKTWSPPPAKINYSMVKVRKILLLNFNIFTLLFCLVKKQFKSYRFLSNIESVLETRE